MEKLSCTILDSIKYLLLVLINLSWFRRLLVKDIGLFLKSSVTCTCVLGRASFSYSQAQITIYIYISKIFYAYFVKFSDRRTPALGFTLA